MSGLAIEVRASTVRPLLRICPLVVSKGRFDTTDYPYFIAPEALSAPKSNFSAARPWTVR